jgi:ribosome-associated protein
MEPISRSQKKRDAQALQRAGKRLMDLSEGQLAALDVPDELKEAIQFAWQLNRKQEAYRRQVQYIGRLMRQLEPQQVASALFEAEQGRELEKRRFRHIERLRDGLVSGDDKLVEWVLEHAPEADRAQLNKLIAGTRGTGGPASRKSASRNLFRYLNQLSLDL